MGLLDFFKKNCNKEVTSPSSPMDESCSFGVCEMSLDMEYTPDNIITLGRRDIFVFGSNLAGHHAGGAARVAINRFGAIWGQGEGLQGNSYAIPTMQGGVESIKPYVERFIELAKRERALTFYVTKIGCGIAGFQLKEIAPLFKNALGLSNIRLPKEFVDIICRDHVENVMREDLLTHTHGVTRTFADLVIARNQVMGFQSPEEVMSYLEQYFDRFKRHGDDVAFIAVRILWNIIYEKNLFEDGCLNVNILKESLLGHDSYGNEMDKAYELHCREKLFNLIVYLNQFRNYRSAEEVLNDVNQSRITHFSHCSPNCDYVMSPIRAGHGYPLFYFGRFLKENWSRIQKKDGTLDPHCLDELMFKRHERGLRKYGLEAVLSHDYDQNPCWGAFIPKRIGSGPVYIGLEKGGYATSCGEGAGPNHIPHYLEYTIAAEILETDPCYENIQGYYIPKFDISLPILGTWRENGIMEFANLEAKRKFITELRQKQKLNL